MYPGCPSTVTLIGPSCDGIMPWLKLAALLHVTPAAGVLAGTRLVPLICNQVLSAITDCPKAVFTEVMMGAPAAAVVMVPEPCAVKAPELFWPSVRVNDPVAPANAPVPPETVTVMVSPRLLKPVGVKMLMLSVALTGILAKILRLGRLVTSVARATVTFPNGAMVPDTVVLLNSSVHGKQNTPP